MIPFNRTGVLRFTNFKDCHSYFSSVRPKGYSDSALAKLWNNAFVVQLGNMGINVSAMVTDTEQFKEQIKCLNLHITNQQKLDVLIDSWLQMHEENLSDYGSMEHSLWLSIVKDEHGIT